MQIESWSPFVAAASPRNRGIIKDETDNISAGGGGATHTHGPRRLKGRLEVHRELRLCHQTPLNTALAPQAAPQHCYGLDPDTLYRNALSCAAAAPMQCSQGRCIGRVERWATLAPPSFVIIARSARSASGVPELEKSVISCSTAPDFFPKLPSSLPAPQQLLLNCRACNRRP